MTQHVAMDQEREAGSHARPRDHPLIAGNAQRRAALADEDVDRFRPSLPLQSSQGAHFLAADRVDGGFPALGAPYMQAAVGEVEGRPTAG